MTKKEFIQKWNVAYESKEQQAEFNNEMLKDLNSIDERLMLVDELKTVSKNSSISFAQWLLCFYKTSEEGMELCWMDVEFKTKHDTRDLFYLYLKKL